MPDGTVRTLKHQYQKNSAPNFTGQGSRGASAVAMPMKIPIREAVKSGYSEARVGGETASTSQQSEVTQDEGG